MRKSEGGAIKQTTRSQEAITIWNKYNYWFKCHLHQPTSRRTSSHSTDLLQIVKIEHFLDGGDGPVALGVKRSTGGVPLKCAGKQLFGVWQLLPRYTQENGLLWFRSLRNILRSAS